MTTHYDDEAQVEQLRHWWRENRLPLTAGLVLGLLVIAGWRGWDQHQDAHAGEASHIFGDLDKAAAAGKYADAAAMADRLAKDFDDTPYAINGALKLAQMAVETNQLDGARQRLQWVVDSAAHPGLLRRALRLVHLSGDAGVPAVLPLAHLRLAQVLWQQGKLDEALKQLDADAGSYAALYDELRGDIKLAQGDRTAARAAYEMALPAADPADRDGLQRKLDDLADAAKAAS